MKKLSLEYLAKLEDDLVYYNKLREFQIAKDKENYPPNSRVLIIPEVFNKLYSNKIEKLKMEIEFLTDYFTT